MQSPPFPHYLVPPRSKYSSQHHILKHPELPFLISRSLLLAMKNISDKYFRENRNYNLCSKPFFFFF
jgi:hypothetical protein